MWPRDAEARLHRGIPMLLPAALLYGAGVAIMRARALRCRRGGATGARVISVGNLEVGGSGKTPLAAELLSRAVQAGKKAAYVGRGYRSYGSRGPYATVLLPEEAEFSEDLAGVRVIGRYARGRIEMAVGDEAALLAERVPGAIIAVSARKQRALDAALAIGAEVVVIDDGFQSWSLPRDLDVVLLDAVRPFGPGRLLPAGTLREKPSALRRADIVVFNGAASDDEVAVAKAGVSQWLRPQARVLGMRRSVAIDGVGGAGNTTGLRIFAVCGIARPGGFVADVRALGLEVVGQRAFPDHHDYGPADVTAVASEAMAARADAIVVTEKDWVKLRRFEWGMPVRVARLDVRLFGAGSDFGIR